MVNVEIERKWLLEGDVPEGLKVIGKCNMYQGYISTKPEVRLRVEKYDDNNCKFEMTIKGEGGIIRDEVQYNITKSEYNRLISIGGLRECQLIHKQYTRYEHGKHSIEVSYVDKGLISEFAYIEIEFSSEEEAKAFKAPEWFGKEITYDSSYKMKNYWKTTRLAGDQQ